MVNPQLDRFMAVCEILAIRRGVSETHLNPSGKDWLWKAGLLHKPPKGAKMLVYHDRRVAIITDYNSLYMVVFGIMKSSSNTNREIVLLYLTKDGEVGKAGGDFRFFTEWVEHWVQMTEITT